MSKVAKSGKMRGLQDRHLRMRHPLIRVHARVELKVNTNGFKWPLNRLCRIFVVFMNRRCLFIFMSIGSRRKESEISGICLFLLTHLNHELTRAAYELRVWVRARAQLKTLASLLRADLHDTILSHATKSYRVNRPLTVQLAGMLTTMPHVFLLN